MAWIDLQNWESGQSIPLSQGHLAAAIAPPAWRNGQNKQKYSTVQYSTVRHHITRPFRRFSSKMGSVVGKILSRFPKPLPECFRDFTTPFAVEKNARKIRLARCLLVIRLGALCAGASISRRKIRECLFPAGREPQMLKNPWKL